MLYKYSSSAKRPSVPTVCITVLPKTPIQFGCVLFGTSLTSLTLLQNSTEKRHSRHGGPSPDHGNGSSASRDDRPAPQGIDPKYVGCALLPPCIATIMPYLTTFVCFARILRIWEAFISFDTDRSGSITVTKLRKLSWAAEQPLILTTTTPDTGLKNGGWPSKFPEYIGLGQLVWLLR
jgi:hypothetical protein